MTNNSLQPNGRIQVFKKKTQKHNLSDIALVNRFVLFRGHFAPKRTPVGLHSGVWSFQFLPLQLFFMYFHTIINVHIHQNHETKTQPETEGFKNEIYRLGSSGEKRQETEKPKQEVEKAKKGWIPETSLSHLCVLPSVEPR